MQREPLILGALLLAAAAQLDAARHTVLARALHDVASNPFFDGFAVACLVAAGVALMGAVMAAVLIPAQPPQPRVGPEPRCAGGSRRTQWAETVP